MKQFLNNIKLNIIVIIACILLLVLEVVSFAWLGTSWNGGEFSVETAYTNNPIMEMWTCHKESSNNYKWYVTYSDDTSKEIPENKVVSNINTSTEEGKFTKNGDFSLYFGTINSLVQEQDNLPVYLKFTIVLPANSKNDISLNYSLPTNYLKAYYAKTTPAVLISDTSTYGTLLSDLNNKEIYSFLNLQYYYDVSDLNNNESTMNYTVDSANNTLNTNFVSLFETESSNLYTYTTAEAFGTNGVLTLTNSTNNLKYFYIYFKFSVPTSTLQKALLDTNLKSYMPIYMVFDTQFELTVKIKDKNSTN